MVIFFHMKCLRVLLIDDDAKFLVQTKEILSREKYSVTAVNNHEKAAAHLRSAKGKTVVLSELNVGKQSGLTFLEDTLRKYPNLPFIFLSKSPTLESVIEALKQGAYDFLRKPVASDILRHSVARSVEKLNLSLETEELEKEARDRLSCLQAELKDARLQSAHKGFLIYMAGHDFKSILTVLDGYFQILKDKCGDCRKAESVQLQEQAVRTILRLKTMASTILDYEAAQRGQLRIESRSFELNSLLQECAVFYRPYAEQKRVRISVEDGLPRLNARGDSERVQQILDNLLYNAIKFTPPNGEIRIGARAEEGKFVTFWIQDTGVGIPKSQLEKIFSKNQIVASKDASARIGLGLSICRKLIEIQNGKIWLESAPGKGTKIFLSLPV
jgi:two-component system, sensor histidine kinase